MKTKSMRWISLWLASNVFAVGCGTVQDGQPEAMNGQGERTAAANFPAAEMPPQTPFEIGWHSYLPSIPGTDLYEHYSENVTYEKGILTYNSFLEAQSTNTAFNVSSGDITINEKTVTRPKGDATAMAGYCNDLKFWVIDKLTSVATNSDSTIKPPATKEDIDALRTWLDKVYAKDCQNVPCPAGKFSVAEKDNDTVQRVEYDGKTIRASFEYSREGTILQYDRMSLDVASKKASRDIKDGLGEAQQTGCDALRELHYKLNFSSMTWEVSEWKFSEGNKQNFSAIVDWVGNL
jgi:hypothetical protein